MESDVSMPLTAVTMKQQFINFVNRSAMAWFVLFVITLIIIIIMSITVAV